MKNLLLFLFLLGSTYGLSAQDSLYLWPTNSGRFLSSTFGETRSAHFHAGLDIKTWGREGYEVYASKDGILSKLLITNQGYGKAIYLKHIDGSYTVYAHLQRFNKEFQSIVDSIRIINYSYTFEKDLESKSIEVKQGDIIGYTGSTGIGPPHLHFEIRNKDNRPLNPLQYNFGIRDTIAPKFSSLLIEPLDIKTKINGSVYPAIVNPLYTKNDTTLFDTLFVTGKFGLSPNVYDEANSVTNKYATYNLSLLLDNDTLYHEKINSFDFTEADKMFVNRVAAPNSDSRRFQRLFTDKNITHPFYISDKQSMKAVSGVYSIVAKDIFGNQSIALIPVEVNNSTKQRKIDDDSYEHWTYDWVSVNDSINIDLTDFKTGVLWDSTTNHRIFDYKDINHTISRLEPDKEYSIISPDYKLRTKIEPNTFFDTLSFVQNWNVVNDTIFVEIGNKELPIRKNILTQIQINNETADLSKFNLYALKNVTEYEFIDSWVSGSTLNALIGSLGKFIVLRDTTAPTIFNPIKVSLDNGLVTYEIKTEDNLSGINFRSAVFKINDRLGIAEYDYENDTFTFYLPSLTLLKQNVIYFEVTDKAGNFASESFLLNN